MQTISNYNNRQLIDSTDVKVIAYCGVYCRQRPVAPVVEVVNLESCLCLSPGFEPQAGRTFDFICKNKNKKDSIVDSALQRG